jgi:hypothetical protein
MKYYMDIQIPTGRVFIKFGIRVFFENLSTTFKFNENLTTCTLHEDLCTFMIISRSDHLKMRNVCRDNQYTHFVFNIFFFSSENRAVCDNVEKCGRMRHAKEVDMIRHMRILCWVPKATGTYLQYVILIAFSRKQRLRENVSVLDLCVHCLSFLGWEGG